MEIGTISNCLKYGEELIELFREQGEIRQPTPTLYNALVIPCSNFDKNWYSAYFGEHFYNTSQTISDFWLQGKKPRNNIEKNLSLNKKEKHFQRQAKNDLIKMLAVAVKGHYFLFKRDVISEPPSILPIPDLNNINIPRYMLVYPFTASQHALVISSIELENISSSTLGLVKFPVIIGKDSHRWIDIEHWKNLEQNGKELKIMLKEKRNKSEIHTHRNIETFPYGYVLDIPQSIVNDMKPTGIRWAEGIERWYLPKGFDLDPVQEYLSYLIHSKEKDEFSDLFKTF